MREISWRQRREDIIRFYELLEELETKLGGKRLLASVHGRMDWPRRGVYFFFEDGEYRTTSGEGHRVVRIGTHGLKRGAKGTLWRRLRQHRGPIKGAQPGGGNHRGSVFRLHVGIALINKHQWNERGVDTWSSGSSAAKEVRDAEYRIEKAVSDHIRKMPFLWLEVDDPAGPNSLRGYIEKNAIALLSNFPFVSTPKEKTHCVDPPSDERLGRWAKNERVAKSGLWNSNHVDEDYDPDSLDALGSLINGL